MDGRRLDPMHLKFVRNGRALNEWCEIWWYTKNQIDKREVERVMPSQPPPREFMYLVIFFFRKIYVASYMFYHKRKKKSKTNIDIDQI